MRPVETAGILTMVVGGGLAYLADYLQAHWPITIAIGLAGSFALWLGVDTILQGRLTLLDRYYNQREYYSGLPAYLMAAILLLFGGGVLLFAAWDWFQPGTPGAFMQGLTGSRRGWGLILVVFGIFLFLFGAARLLAGSAHRPDQRNLVTDLGFRAGGLLVTLLGLLLVAGGLWLLLGNVMPGDFL